MLEYSLLTEAYSDQYVCTVHTSSVSAGDQFLLGLGAGPYMYLADDIKNGAKLKIVNGELKTDRRCGLRRFFSRDSRKKTMSFLAQAHRCSTLDYRIIMVYLVALRDYAYKHDTAWVKKANELLVEIRIPPPSYTERSRLSV